MKINILFVIPTMESGGVEMGMLEFAKYNFNNKDLNIFLISSGGTLINKIVHYGVKYIKLDVKSKNPFVILGNIREIKNIIRENKINIVQVESRAPAWSCLYTCKALNIPLITVAQFNGLFKKNFFLKKKYNSIMFRGNPVIMVSNAVKNIALTNYKYLLRKKKFLRNIEVVYRGIDPEIYNQKNVNQNRILMLQDELKLPEDKIIITVPSRFTKQKGQEYLLNVLRFLKNENYICLLVGDIRKNPKYVKKIEKLVYKFNLQNYVKICNNISDMPALYVLSNIIISPSIQPEAFGRISIETQSMEKIFIGTAVGGTLETVKNEETGFLVPENNPKEFAEILDKVINLTSAETEKIKKQARQNILDNFTFDLMYNKMLNIYKKIVDDENFWNWN